MPSPPQFPEEPVPIAGLRVSARLTIPYPELTIRASRSSGAGGQHVNKTASRVEAVWNVRQSAVLTDEQRSRLLTTLGTRLTEGGDLRVVASDTRSQTQNRDLALGRLAELVRRGLVVPKVRKATAPTRAAKRARLERKKRQSLKKQERRRPIDE